MSVNKINYNKFLKEYKNWHPQQTKDKTARKKGDSNKRQCFFFVCIVSSVIFRVVQWVYLNANYFYFYFFRSAFSISKNYKLQTTKPCLILQWLRGDPPSFRPKNEMTFL